MGRIMMAGVLLGALSGAALGNFQIGDAIYIGGHASGDDKDNYWGNDYDQQLLPHAFGGTTIFEDSYTYTIEVTSGLLPTPPGKSFAGWIEVDLSGHAFSGAWDSFQFGVNHYAGEELINSATVAAGVGSVVLGDSDYAFFWFSSDVAGVRANPVIRIEWTQVPAPGAAALLLAGGLGMSRRRR